MVDTKNILVIEGSFSKIFKMKNQNEENDRSDCASNDYWALSSFWH